MERIAKLATVVGAALVSACGHSSRLDVRVTVPPDVLASYAESLPAAVVISGTKLGDGGSSVGSTFATRRIRLVCDSNARGIAFHATIQDSRCGVETRVEAWLQSQAGLRDLLEGDLPVAGTDHVTQVQAASGAPATRNMICGALEPIEMIIDPSAVPSSTSPRADGIAFSGQHGSDCDRESDSVSLVLNSPQD